MKSMNFLMILMIFGAYEFMHASAATPQATAAADGATTIYNKSNVPVLVAYNVNGAGGLSGPGSVVYWGASIPANSTGSLAYKSGDKIQQVTIFYNATSTSSLGNATDGQIRFYVTIIDGASLFVYGNDTTALPIGATDSTTATPVPSRYAAWWTGTMTAANTPGTLLTMHSGNANSANDYTLTGASAPF